MVNRDKDLAQKIIKMEETNALNIGDITIPAKISRDLKMEGWVLPTGKITNNKELATQIAINLNKTINMNY